ncbi:MAG TPA: DUF2975 domain-containing protein [Ilumatobacteraceae bacterium]|nr:DUF2975 domain-containing protein [Ilumatobacteraceae bacterium]
MEPRPRNTSRLGIQLFDAALRILIVGLSAITVASVVLVMLFLTGRGPIAVPSTLDPPYGIELLDAQDRSIGVGDAGTVVRRTNFASGDEARYIKSAPTVVVDSRVDRTDSDTRVLLSGSGLVLLALAWAATLNLFRIVRAAADGDPFAPSNAGRLRMIAATVLAVPVVGGVTVQVLDATLDSDPAVTPLSPGVAWLGFVVVSLGLFALAEVFRQGADLRQFEMETV